MRRLFHPVRIFAVEPYSQMLAYPRPTRRVITARMAELKKLGVTHVCFDGPTRLGSIDVLGKGYVGVVILARRRGSIVAVKIRRTDSQRRNMAGEAKLLDAANKVQVGPRLIAHSKNCIVMEYLSGKKIGQWVKGASAARFRTVTKKILGDCHKLDEMGLDHGELSCPAKHVIIGSKTTILDFESSSTVRRASNVTSATQGIFIGSGISRDVSRICALPRKDKMIAALRKYKKTQDKKNFKNLISVLGLDAPDPLAHLSKDPKMRMIIRKVGPYMIRRTPNKYESLVRAIITQQLSGYAARSITAKFKAMYGSRFPRPGDVAKTPYSKLRAAGLSKMKIGYIRDISKRIESGQLQLGKFPKMSDEDIIEELTRIRGIGRWTAEMFLIFTLGRMDVLPVGDLGLKKGVRDLYDMKELPSEDHIRKVAQKWCPYRTAATWYLWQSLSLEDLGS